MTLEKRVASLEKKVSQIERTLESTLANVRANGKDIINNYSESRINYRRILADKTRYDKLLKQLNRNVDLYDKKFRMLDSHDNVWSARVQLLEKQFSKFDKAAQTPSKGSDLKTNEKNLMKLVDSAMKAYDKKRR